MNAAEGAAQGCDGHSKGFTCFLSVFLYMPCNRLACFVLQVLSVPVTRVMSIPQDICAHGSASRHWEVRSRPGGTQALS